MRLWGALLIVSGSGWMGLRAARQLRMRARALRELEQAMAMLGCWLERFCLSTPELARQTARSSSGAGAALLSRWANELEKADERPLSERWTAACASLERPWRDVLEPVGEVLGRFGMQEQCAAVGQAGMQLSRLAQQAEERSRSSGKLFAALGFSLGAIAALVLV